MNMPLNHYAQTNQMLLKAFNHQPIAFVDVETTGMSPLNNRMIEIGVFRINPDGSTQSYTSLVNPHQFLSPFIKNMTGIQQSDVDSAKSFEGILSTLKPLLDNAVFIAHNARFDYSFIQSEFLRHEHPFISKTLCTVQLSKKLYPKMKRHGLAHLIETFDIAVHRRHRAIDDATVMYEWLHLSRKMLGEEIIQTTIQSMMQHRIKNILIPQSTLDSLPESSGAYIFRDAKGCAVYVGETVNLKKSVWSHLHENTSRSSVRKIAELSFHLNHYKTSGELSAHLKSSELIQSERPILNKKITPHQKYVACIETKNLHGYKTLHMKPLFKTDPFKESVIATFKSKKYATRTLTNLTREWDLCEKLMGFSTDHDTGSEFHLKTCKGACAVQESTDTYNQRFNSAFEQYKFCKWPYPDTILILEQAVEGGVETAFLIAQWTIQATVHFDDNGQNIHLFKGDFDWEIYWMLCRFFKTKPNNLLIQPLEKHEAQQFLSREIQT